MGERIPMCPALSCYMQGMHNIFYEEIVHKEKMRPPGVSFFWQKKQKVLFWSHLISG